MMEPVKEGGAGEGGWSWRRKVERAKEGEAGEGRWSR